MSGQTQGLLEGVLRVAVARAGMRHLWLLGVLALPGCAPMAADKSIAGITDPREALFAHVIGTYRKTGQFAERTICLAQADEALVANLDRRFGGIEPESSCGGKDGAVVLATSGESALFVHAKVDCDRAECTGEAGAIYVGGEGHQYRLRRQGDGWTVRETGVSWVS